MKVMKVRKERVNRTSGRPDSFHHVSEVHMSDADSRSQEFQFSGDTLLAKIRELLHEGNVRRVIIKNDDGRVLIDIPLTIGVVGTLLAPQLAAIGAIAALVMRGTIVIEKETTAQ